MYTSLIENLTNLTTTTVSPLPPETTIPAYVGYLALTLSIVFFGSNYLPVKQFETGDGMFFQLLLTTAIWTVGFVVYCIRGYPKFYSLPMLGGFFWSMGNLTVVPIIKLIGIGLGTLFWNTVLLVIGWAVARFGLFGVKPEVPSNPILNYVGVALTVISGIFFLFIKSESSNVAEDRQRLIIHGTQVNTEVSGDVNIADVLTDHHPATDASSSTFLGSCTNPTTRRVVGISLACFSGVLYAVTFTPALYVQDNYENASQNALDYVFSLYTGIFVTSIANFVIYCIIKRNKPQVYASLMLPAIISGLMWGCANSSFFLANNALTQAITFPIVSSGPCAISALWGILLYKEIKGQKNLAILGCGFALAVTGSILCGISK